MSAGELVARCFAARTAAHIAHLRTRSYSAHMALGEYYGRIVDLADSFAEVYQGQFGLIQDWPDEPVPSTAEDTATVIAELRDWAKENRDACARGQTDLENLVDEITAQCSRTVYKLTNLK